VNLQKRNAKSKVVRLARLELVLGSAIAETVAMARPQRPRELRSFTMMIEGSMNARLDQ